MRKTIFFLILMVSQQSLASMPVRCEASFEEIKGILASVFPEFIAFKSSYESAYGKLSFVSFSTGKAHTNNGIFDFPWPAVVGHESIYASRLNAVAHFCVNEEGRNWGCFMDIDTGKTRCELSEVEVIIEETANKAKQAGTH